MALPFSLGHNSHLVDGNLAALGTASNPLFCSVTGAGSGGTSSADKAAFTAGSSAGTALMGVTSPTDTGLAANLIAIAALDANRNLCVNVKAGSGSGVSVTDEAAFTAGTSVFVPSGGVFNDSAAALTSGQQGTVRSTANRALHVNLRKSDATELATLAAPLRTDPTGTTTQPVSGTVTANAGSGVYNDQHSDVELDYDSGVGTQNITIFGIALPASGGAVAGGTATNPIRTDPTGTTTQPISAASLPLPTGAATSAKQPALGTAGTASSDVITIQGIASMTAVKVDGSAVTQPVSGTVTTNNAAATTGGATPYHYISAASANQDSQNVKGSAGTLYSISATNINTSPRYLKIYDKATAPTSADTPIFTFLIPGNTSGTGTNPHINTCGIALANGLGIRLTTGSADNDANAVAASDIIVNLSYK